MHPVQSIGYAAAYPAYPLNRAPVNILQSGARTSMVLNLDVRYVLAIKSDVTLHPI